MSSALRSLWLHKYLEMAIYMTLYGPKPALDDVKGRMKYMLAEKMIDKLPDPIEEFKSSGMATQNDMDDELVN